MASFFYRGLCFLGYPISLLSGRTIGIWTLFGCASFLVDEFFDYHRNFILRFLSKQTMRIELFMYILFISSTILQYKTHSVYRIPQPKYMKWIIVATTLFLCNHLPYIQYHSFTPQSRSLSNTILLEIIHC